MGNDLFVIDSITVDGAAIAIEESSATVDGLLGFENEAVASASGEHGQMRKRVVPVVKAKLMFFSGMTTEEMQGWTNVQLVLRQTTVNKRVRLSKASISKLGEVGNGNVDVEFNVLGRVQWL